MSAPNRQAWSVTSPHEPDCWCQFCFFRRLERVEAETELALRRRHADGGQQRAVPVQTAWSEDDHSSAGTPGLAPEHP